MATWQLNCVLTDNSTVAAASTNHIWWSGAAWGANIITGDYPDSMHIADQADAHICTVHHIHNTKYVSSTQVSIDGGGNTNLPVSTGNCGLHFNFSDPSSIQTRQCLFYAYDGSSDINPMANVTFQAAEGAHSTTWSAANGSASALALVDQSPATSHDFYVATSIAPLTVGAKVGKFKITLVYV